MEAGRERDELSAALEREGYSPVYLDQSTVDLHYNGFCNTVLWQLFHYVPLNIGAAGGGEEQGEKELSPAVQAAAVQLVSTFDRVLEGGERRTQGQAWRAVGPCHCCWGASMLALPAKLRTDRPSTIARMRCPLRSSPQEQLPWAAPA